MNKLKTYTYPVDIYKVGFHPCSQFSRRGDTLLVRRAQLLCQAGASDGGQARAATHFIAATFDGHVFKLDPFDLRAVDIPVSDDMLACLDALRWGRSDLHTLVPDGERRILAMCSARGLQWRDN